MLSRTSCSALSSSSRLPLVRASFSTSVPSQARPSKGGPSVMGIAHKHRVNAKYHKDGGGVVKTEKPKKSWRATPHLDGGHLIRNQLEDLISLYHSTQNHITVENLDDVIDAAFVPFAHQPRNTRPKMASLLDLHTEMNNPGSLTHAEHNNSSTSAISAPNTSGTREKPSPPPGQQPWERGDHGASPPAHLVEARAKALELLHSDPDSPAHDPRKSGGPQSKIDLTLEPHIHAGISPLSSSVLKPTSGPKFTSPDFNPQAFNQLTTTEAAAQDVNDWVGASESAMTPREKLLVQALYGVEDAGRPGLAMVEGETKRLEVERERARLEVERLREEQLRKEITEEREWRESMEEGLVERMMIEEGDLLEGDFGPDARDAEGQEGEGEMKEGKP